MQYDYQPVMSGNQVKWFDIQALTWIQWGSE